MGTTKYPFLLPEHLKCLNYYYLLDNEVYLFHVVASYLLVHSLLVNHVAT
jgi:hypothetical protein